MNQGFQAPRKNTLERRLAAPYDGLADVAREHLLRLRAETNTPLAAVGEAMRASGFNWGPETCWRFENGDRTVILDELLALAILFGEPLIHFIVPRDRPGEPPRALLIPQLDEGEALRPLDAAQLIAGRDGRIGYGGAADWPIAQAVLSDRPLARALWQQRQANSGEPT